jgi:lipopolysaccharide transport system permease protein
VTVTEIKARESKMQSTNVQLERVADIPFVRIEHSRGWASLKLQELWQYRELVYIFVWRDLKVRYKQTAIGLVWAILQPLMTMIIFTLVFGKFAKMPSDGLPYAVFSYAALLPWNYFARSLTGSISSVVENAHLITKVYFPRLLLPISATLSGIIDFGISFIFLLGMMTWFGFVPTWGALLLPLFLLLIILTALSVSLWLSVINVRYRDVGQAMPLLVQLWLFASPVAYPVSVVPQQWRLLYSLNPMTGVIEGFRWALFGKENPPLIPLMVSMVVVAGLLWGGMVFFKRMELTFAEVV